MVLHRQAADYPSPAHSGAAKGSLSAAAFVARHLQWKPQTPTSPMKLEFLHDLYIHELQALYSTELQIAAALPKLIEGACGEDLKQALQTHQLVTKLQIERLDNLIRRHGSKPGGETCQSMRSVLEGCAAKLTTEGDALLRDLAILSNVQRIEHYEMAGYGSARTLAERLGEEADAFLLAESMEEENSADDELTSVAILLLSQVEVEQVV
jgi:ferritin-like metal-binding protein YciE